MNWSKAALAVCSILVFMFWLSVPNDEYEDPDERYIVTFSYDCRLIVDEDDVPEHVMEECRKIFKELQDELKPTKSSI